MQWIYITITGAIYSVLHLVIPALFIKRLTKWKIRNLDEGTLIITINDLILVAAIIYPMFLIADVITNYFSAVEYKQYTFLTRLTGPYWWAYLLPFAGTVLLPQLIWFKRFRVSVKICYAWFILSSILPWLEFLVLMTSSFHRDYIPSSFSSIAAYATNYYFFPSLLCKLFYLLLGFALLVVVYFIVSKIKSKAHNPIDVNVK